MAVGEESMPSCYSTVIPRLVISNSRWRVVSGLFKTVQNSPFYPHSPRNKVDSEKGEKSANKPPVAVGFLQKVD